VRGLNTYVAIVPNSATSDECTAIALLLTGLGSNGSLSPETLLVLIFEVGQK
jgi:hypothetical protein